LREVIDEAMVSILELVDTLTELGLYDVDLEEGNDVPDS